MSFYLVEWKQIQYIFTQLFPICPASLGFHLHFSFCFTVWYIPKNSCLLFKKNKTKNRKPNKTQKVQRTPFQALVCCWLLLIPVQIYLQLCGAKSSQLRQLSYKNSSQQCQWHKSKEISESPLERPKKTSELAWVRAITCAVYSAVILMVSVYWGVIEQAFA